MVHLFIAFTTQQPPVRAYFYLKSSVLFQASHWKLNEIQRESAQLWSVYSLTKMSLEAPEKLQSISDTAQLHNFQIKFP